jgi:hypothetical protein
MKNMEWMMYQQCLGLACNKGQGATPNDVIYYVSAPNNPPSPEAFWECVRQKGPPLGITIATDPAPVIVQCNQACSFTGCGRCSDDVGTGVVTGQLVDAVYNQVVPSAKLSLFYKGVLVKQTSSDDDGKFTFTGLNERPECSQYKIVVDSYKDNPCTGQGIGRPSCGGAAFPAWTVQGSVDEGQRGGYWPLTTPSFTAGNFAATVSPQNKDGHIFLFPRPGVGEAYLTVLWDVPWKHGDVTVNGQQFPWIWGGYNAHVVLPKQAAYTMPTSGEVVSPDYPANFSPSLCSYDNRPAVATQCVRDVTWTRALKGHEDSVLDILFDKKSKSIFTCGADCTFRIWQ